jgi:hypothetical protein
MSGSPASGRPPCCGPPTACCGSSGPPKPAWVKGAVATAAGDVPRVAAELSLADRLGAWRVRWAVGRMDYSLEPGLYAVGEPTPGSPVLVTANYKLSFDCLRSRLTGRDAWILVLDTAGINVWCAAGKGTFGTEELVARVAGVRLGEVVSHRQLIVPQLGATGVCAHEVRQRSGFRVVYGPVRAEDLPAFLDAGMEATPAMRRVRFPLADRAVLIPVELVAAAKYALILALAMLLLGGLGRDGYSLARVLTAGAREALLALGLYLAAVVLPPLLLPWLPGRAFSAKGAWLGGAIGVAVLAAGLAAGGALGSPVGLAAWLALAVTITSFLAMNFTGASTYTSLSGVRREMATAVPLQLAGGVLGLALWIVGRFV